MINKIVNTFEANFTRLQNLLKMYHSLGGGNPGRSNTSQLELLRATVVLTHSTLEDFLRSLEIWKIPLSETDILKDIWLKDNYRQVKFNFQDIYKHKNIRVKTLLEKSIVYTLNQRSYNQTQDIIRAINNCGLNVTEGIQELLPELNLLMNRRHHIVHQADKNTKTGSGQHKYLSLSLRKVQLWINNTDLLANQIINQL